MKDQDKPALMFVIHHLLFGVIGGGVIGGALLFFDMFGLWTLIKTSNDGTIALVALFGGLIITFGSLGMGIGIMSLGDARDD